MDVHRLGAVDSAEDPVVFVSRLKDDDCELLRDNEGGPLRDDVRSNKRVWYGNGAADRGPLDVLDDRDSGRSMRA